jgi:Kdo2-lipid IVA lauroyltransferase/acyltransferase
MDRWLQPRGGRNRDGVPMDHSATRRTERLLGGQRFTFFGLKFLHLLNSVLPVDTVSRLGARIALGVGPRTRRHSRALVNIARAFPELSPKARGQIARGMWENFGRTIAESFVIRRLLADETRVLCDEVTVRRVLKRKGGAIFVGLHFGNWELSVTPAARFGESPIGLYKPFKNHRAGAYFLQMREGLYPSGLLPTTPASLLKVARHVREGGSVCMLADHSERGGPAVPFFGHLAPSLSLPARLSVKFGVPVFAARVDRLEGANFSVHIEEIASIRTGDKNADIEATTAAIQALFERWIRARPDQWVWFYKRWRAEDFVAANQALEMPAP